MITERMEYEAYHTNDPEEIISCSNVSGHRANEIRMMYTESHLTEKVGSYLTAGGVIVKCRPFQSEGLRRGRE